MGWITLLGFAAGTMTTLSFVPQVHKAWRSKRCDDLSLGMLLAFGLGVFLWLVYGLALRKSPIIAANAVTLALIVALVVLKAKYGSRTRPIRVEMINKQQLRRIRMDIRRVLLNVWDPIGVKDEPNAQDEYDCCVGHLVTLLTRGASDDEIVDYLWERGTEHMGLSLHREELYRTVEALRQIELHGIPASGTGGIHV